MMVLHFIVMNIIKIEIPAYKKKIEIIYYNWIHDFIY